MSSYVENTLGKGEEIRYLAQLSYWPYTGRILAAFVLLLLPRWLPWWTVVFGLSILAHLYLLLESVELAVTNRRIIVKTGLIQRSTSELYLNRVEGVEVEQSAKERLLGYGTVNIRGVGTEIAPVSHISAPLAFRRAFFDAADAMMAGADTHSPFPPHVRQELESADESAPR